MNNLVVNIFVGFAIGIICYKIFELNFLILLISTLILILLVRFLNQKFYYYVLIFAVFILAGFLQSNFSEKRTEILFDKEKKYQFVGQIISEPEKREFNQKIIFQPNNLKEKILINTTLSKNFNYDDVISIKGKLKVPENFESQQDIEFDYVNFLKKERIFYQMNYAEIETIKSGDSFFNKLFRFKNFFVQAVNENLPSPQAELVGGILLGLKSSLGKKLELDFRRVGLIHIVVLSGYNITIITIAILAILFFLPLKIRLITGLGAIILFSVLVGGGATVIRAGIMSAIAIFSKFFHKNYDVNKALFLAGFIMIFQNPDILIYDPSFQLSFLATYGLINFSPKVKFLLNFLPEEFGFKEIIISTVATQIAVFPLLSKMMGEISIVSLIVNVIVLPTIPLAMLLGFLTGFFGMISNLVKNFHWPFIILDYITKLIGFFTNLVLGYIIKITESFSNLPFATIALPKISWLQITLIYCLIIIIFNYQPIQIGKKIFNILTLTTWKIIRNKRMFPHIKS